MEGQSCGPWFIGWDITGPFLSEAAWCLVTWHWAALTSCCTLAEVFWRPHVHTPSVSLTHVFSRTCLILESATVCVIGNYTLLSPNLDYFYTWSHAFNISFKIKCISVLNFWKWTGQTKSKTPDTVKINISLPLWSSERFNSAVIILTKSFVVLFWIEP